MATDESEVWDEPEVWKEAAPLLKGGEVMATDEPEVKQEGPVSQFLGSLVEGGIMLAFYVFVAWLMLYGLRAVVQFCIN